MNQRIFPMTMPKWGIENAARNRHRVARGSGQKHRERRAIVDVETDKIVNSVEAPVSGVLRFESSRTRAPSRTSVR